jgi:hypothetical protein
MSTHLPLQPPGLADLRPPMVIFCKSHSGSRLLVEMLRRAGVFMGAHCNSSGDSWDLVPLIRYLVIHHYPNYERALAGEDPLLVPMIAAAFARHLDGYEPASGEPWGWKVCETTYILPVIRALFPQARFVHLVRDGRDVAFSNHTGPVDEFWRKVFFGRADIDSWQGMALTGPSYRRRPHLFNAQHWLASVSLGHRMAAELGDQCLELRLEDLCLDPDSTIPRLLDFIGIAERQASLPEMDGLPVGRFRHRAGDRVCEVLPLIAPLQAELGYPTDAT